MHISPSLFVASSLNSGPAAKTMAPSSRLTPYKLPSPRTRDMRFFYKMRTFSHEVVQKQWSSVDYHKNMSIIGLVQKGGHKEIMAIGSYAEEKAECAEVAFVVREDFQGNGVASYLLEILEKIAKENQYRSFSATVLRENAAMIRVFKKRYPNAKISVNGGSDLQIQMKFDGAINRDDTE